MLSGIMLSGIMLSGIMLSGIMLQENRFYQFINLITIYEIAIPCLIAPDSLLDPKTGHHYETA